MRKLALVMLLGVVVVGCDGFDAPITSSQIQDSEIVFPLAKDAASVEDFTRITAMVDRINEDLEAKGSEIRLDYPWLFRVGLGTDPWARLRTGSRWTALNVGYILDESDYTDDVDFATVDAVMQKTYQTWNEVKSSNLRSIRLPDGGGNYDVLDGIIRNSAGDCVDVIDITSPNFDLATGNILPAANIVVGGWIDPAYFSDCLGSSAILGVTWTFSGPDGNGDNYRDRLYVEQYYNPAFAWTTTDAQYLNFSAPIDIESVALHENGHAHGLGHFGGPVRNAPLQLKPNLKVFTPEAVMNPGYLGGEQREPLPTDVAGMRTLYGRSGQ